MKNLLRLIPLTAAVALTVMGCGAGGGGGGDGGPREPAAAPVVSSLERERVPRLEPGDLDVTVAGVNALGFDLLRASSGNVIVEPTVLAYGVAKLYAGANGETVGELSRAAGFTLAPERLLPALNALDLEVSGRREEGGRGFRLSSNATAQSGYGYRLAYFDALARNFGLKPEPGDFARSGSNTRLSFRDEVSLADSWLLPFDPSQTRDEVFVLEGGGRVSVPMLHRTGSFRSLQAEEYFAVEVSLALPDLSLLFVTPAEGKFAAFEASWTGERLREILGALAPADLELGIPSFALDAAVSVPEVLEARGLSRARMADGPDFSGIDGTKDLYVSSLGHSASFSLSEGGASGRASFSSTLDDAHPNTWTRPGSAGSGAGFVLTTDSGNWGGSVEPAPPPAISLVRPFLFALRDAGTGSVLFLGRVLNPAPDAPVTYEVYPAKAQTLKIEGTLVYRSE